MYSLAAGTVLGQTAAESAEEERTSVPQETGVYFYHHYHDYNYRRQLISSS